MSIKGLGGEIGLVAPREDPSRKSLQEGKHYVLRLESHSESATADVKSKQ